MASAHPVLHLATGLIKLRNASPVIKLLRFMMLPLKLVNAMLLIPKETPKISANLAMPQETGVM